MKNDIEIWKDIKDYEGLYQVSNLGRVRSLDRLVKGRYNNYALIKGRLRCLGVNGCGYQHATLCKNGRLTICLVHRLVAQAFIPNPDNLPCVNHKDEDKTNNNVSNLEWCDYRYNMTYSYGKQVAQIDIQTNEIIKIWESTHEIERSLGFRHQNISSCCSGKYETAYKYKWNYVTND